MIVRGLISSLQDFDHRRSSFPGEHLMVATVGTALLRSAFRRKSLLGSALMFVAAGALLYRAASGRDGIARLWRPENRQPVPATAGPRPSALRTSAGKTAASPPQR